MLLRRLLAERQAWDVRVALPVATHGVDKLVASSDLVESRLHFAARRPDASSILVLLDGDTGCALDRALPIVSCAERLHLPVPVAVAVAKCEYESWFVASIESLAGRPLKADRGEGHRSLEPHISFDGDPETLQDPKRWLTRHMPGSCAYKETFDQAPLTAAMDLDLARANSRSFRHFESAVCFLMEAVRAGRTGVSPSVEALRERLGR